MSSFNANLKNIFDSYYQKIHNINKNNIVFNNILLINYKYLRKQQYICISKPIVVLSLRLHNKNRK